MLLGSLPFAPGNGHGHLLGHGPPRRTTPPSWGEYRADRSGCHTPRGAAVERPPNGGQS